MDEYIRVSGKTVEDAILEASIQLQTTSDNIEYQVIEYDTKGFLGIGAKKAVIEAKVRRQEEDIVKEVFEEPARPAIQKPEKKEAGRKDEIKAAGKPDAEKKPEWKAESKKEENKKEENKKEGRAPIRKEISAEDREIQKGSRVPADPKVAAQRAEDFLQGVFSSMQMKAQVSTAFSEDTLLIELSGEDMGILIGKRGQTLDSLQYLTSLVVNKGKASYVRVKLDTENYRERRKDTLENLAKNIAFKVKKTRKSVYLEPMNPYERRIIHSALQNDPYVTTHSEGEEPLRKVVVALRKRERAEEEEQKDYRD